MSQSSPAARIQANLQELFQGKSVSGDPYVKFQLTSKITALLSMKQVEATSIVEAALLTPLPNMPPTVVGIINSGDRVFCVFDLAQLLGLPSGLVNPRQYQIIVLQTTDEQPINLGLAVMGLQGIIRFPAAEIQTTTENFPAQLVPYLSGVIRQSENTFPILKLDYILQLAQTTS